MNNNDYIYHAIASRGTARKDHKYLSREWKNGRWNYQYEQPKNNTVSMPGGGRDNSTAIARRGSTGVGTSTNRPTNKNESIIDSAKRKVENWYNNAKQDWEEAKARGTEAARKEATKYDGGISIGKYGAKKIGKTTFTDIDDLLSGSTTMTIDNTQVSEIRRGKIERYVDTAKEYIKDRLGYDEKAAYESASKRDGASGADKDQKREAYMNTTIGKLEQAKSTIDAGVDYLENLFKKKRK